jgi:hypothetical protein
LEGPARAGPSTGPVASAAPLPRSRPPAGPPQGPSPSSLLWRPRPPPACALPILATRPSPAPGLPGLPAAARDRRAALPRTVRRVMDAPRWSPSRPSADGPDCPAGRPAARRAPTRSLLPPVAAPGASRPHACARPASPTGRPSLDSMRFHWGRRGGGRRIHSPGVPAGGPVAGRPGAGREARAPCARRRAFRRGARKAQAPARAPEHPGGRRSRAEQPHEGSGDPAHDGPEVRGGHIVFGVRRGLEAQAVR